MKKKYLCRFNFHLFETRAIMGLLFEGEITLSRDGLDCATVEAAEDSRTPATNVSLHFADIDCLSASS
jgi:hypothetical protein